MLTSGHSAAETATDRAQRQDEQPLAELATVGNEKRRLRWLAAGLGLLGTLLALSVPFLPVVHDIVTLNWPTQQGTGPVSAPLVSYQPMWLRAEVPCTAMRDLGRRSPGSAVVFDTNPPSSKYNKITGMSLRVTDGNLIVTNRGQQLAATSVPSGDCTASLRSDPARTTIMLGGRTLVDLHEDARPQVTGIFSDLNASKDNVHGLHVAIRTDTRYQTTATVLKAAVMILATAAFIGCLIVLHRVDVRAGRRAPRLAPRGWWKPTGRDLTVYAVLVTWWVIGASTSDDGYILTMARAKAESGYIGNYFRWFNAPEAPFGWFYQLYSVWVQISTATPWLRLPSLLMGVCSWLLISRETLPRLGRAVRRSRAAGWAAAAVFLCFWLPYNNGLRPEPVVAIFALLAMCAVERAVAARRLLPVASGLFAASLALAATPTGLIAVLPFLAAARPLLRLLRDRIRAFGRLSVMLPLTASGTVVLSAIFYDQTLRSVLDGTKVKTALGPSEPWYMEFDRYQLLFSATPDGSLARRFPVLLVILCLATCLVVLLRRGKIRGAALGPSSRLIGITMLSFGVLALTPTKWTHHFGAFAALGGSLAALTALATSATVLRSRRNRALFTGGLLIIAALAFTGPNGWWYVSDWGVPWFDKLPSFHGHTASTVLLFGAVIAFVIAGIEHLRVVEPGTAAAPDPSGDQTRRRVRPRLENRSRALLLGSTPLALVCALLVFGEVASMVKAIQKDWGSYSLGKDNYAQLVGNSCGLSDYVYVEPNPLKDVLTPDPASQGSGSTPVMDGFRQNGLPPGDGSDPSQPDWRPPYGLGGDNAPVWGTYDPAGPKIGELRTPWYTLPERARTGAAPLVITLAGLEAGANTVTVEFGRHTASGFQVVAHQQIIKGTGFPNWREARLMLSGPAAQAGDVRLVATARALGSDGWMALAAPRVPTLTRMTTLIGNSPVFMEWPVALAHPCLRPAGMRNGIADMPAYRVAPSSDYVGVSNSWSAGDAGGTFGWLNVASSVRMLPTFLKGNLDRNWGTLYAIDPYNAPAAPAAAAEQVTHETHWGLWSDGPTSVPIQMPGDAPKSDSRTSVSVGTNQ